MSKNQSFNNGLADAKDINVDVEAAAVPSELDGIFAIKVEQRTVFWFFFFSSSAGNVFSLSSRLCWQESNATARHGGGHSWLISPGLLPATWHKWLLKVKLAFFTWERPKFIFNELHGSTSSS